MIVFIISVLIRRNICLPNRFKVSIIADSTCALLSTLRFLIGGFPLLSDGLGDGDELDLIGMDLNTSIGKSGIFVDSSDSDINSFSVSFVPL